jgi:hypothetical protein
MDEKISLEAIALYGDKYSEKVVKSYFSGKDRISGSEILSFCDIKQVNLFIIKELFKSWKEEQKKIKSPYFNYDNEEVKEAWENLMNLLSKNISIDQAHFQPLVKKAVSQTLLAIFDPYDFFSMIITGKNNKLEIASFREEIKYLKVNRAPLERMLQTLEEKNLTEISGNEAFGILDRILEEVNFNPEDIEHYIEKFSSIVPLDPNFFFVSKTPEPSSTLPLRPSFEQNVPKPFPKEEEPVKIDVEKNHELAQPKPVTNEVNYSYAPSAKTVPSINEKHTREPRPTVAENFQRIKKIKDSLTINQKFMFTKVLFHGDFELFTKAVDRLDQLDTLPAAIKYIEEEHASTWDRESEEFHEFMELVEKRFV